MEFLTNDDWRPSHFIVVAQLDVTRSQLESMGFTIRSKDGEETAFVGLSSGYIYMLHKMPENPVVGYALICGDPADMDWAEALDLFLAEMGLGQSTVLWAPGPDDDESQTQ